MDRASETIGEPTKITYRAFVLSQITQSRYLVNNLCPPKITDLESCYFTSKLIDALVNPEGGFGGQGLEASADIALSMQN